MTDQEIEIRDLDETRRLLYMALACQSAGKRAELVGTLVNALRHHSRLMEGAVMDNIAEVLRMVSTNEGRRFASMLISACTYRIGHARQADNAPSVPEEVINALATLDMLLGTFTDGARDGGRMRSAFYRVTFSAETIEQAREALIAAEIAVGRKP